MHRSSIRIAIVVVGALCCPSVGTSQQSKESSRQEQSKPGKTTPEARTQQASLSGCVDPQDGRYVLIHDQSRELIAQLEADGFETEGFAKHLGHKVTVRGTGSSNGTERPVFKVRSVETISDSCGQLQVL